MAVNARVAGFWVLLFAAALLTGAYLKFAEGKMETAVALVISALCPGIIGVNVILTAKPKPRPPA